MLYTDIEQVTKLFKIVNRRHIVPVIENLVILLIFIEVFKRVSIHIVPQKYVSFTLCEVVIYIACSIFVIVFVVVTLLYLFTIRQVLTQLLVYDSCEDVVVDLRKISRYLEMCVVILVGAVVGSLLEVHYFFNKVFV